MGQVRSCDLYYQHPEQKLQIGAPAYNLTSPCSFLPPPIWLIQLGLTPPTPGPSTGCFSQGKMPSLFSLAPYQASSTALCHTAFPDSVFLANMMLFKIFI